MKVKFAVYAYRNIPYEEETFRISGDFETIEEALNFKELAEKTEVRNILMTKEIFVATIIESLGDKINTDDDDSAHRLGEFTRDMGNVEKIELLPYHELGKHKWVAMGEEYKLDGVHPPKKETMDRVKGILEQYGHKVMY